MGGDAFQSQKKGPSVMLDCGLHQGGNVLYASLYPLHLEKCQVLNRNSVLKECFRGKERSSLSTRYVCNS